MSLNFWQMRHQLDALKLVTEELTSVEKGTHLEVTPSHMKKPLHSGTAIEHRDNPSHYGADGHAALDTHVKSVLADPSKNSVHKSADSYMKEHLGHGYEFHDDKPKSNLRKQYVIGKTYDLATRNDPEYKRRVFDGYAKNRPDIVKQTRSHDYDSLVQGSYKRVAHETNKQFEHMPVRTQYHDGSMGYHNSGEMLRDIHGHNNLTVYRGGDRHEYLHHTDKTGLNENEKFRAVHDYYGHGIHGNQFGPKGEEVAWHSHRKMFSHGAAVAMTSETRGQNSYVNYTHANLATQKEMEGHRKDKRTALNAGDFEGANHADAKLREAGGRWNYAKQASVALPHEMLHPHFDGHAPNSIAHMLHDPAAAENPTYDVHKDHLGLVDLARHHNTSSHTHQNGGVLDRENAHSDLKHIAGIHGYTKLSHNPFKG
jgi:hypothetical protein